MHDKKQLEELDMEQQTGSKQAKEYVKAVYCHTATLYGTTDWFKIEKGVQQGCLLLPCLFNLDAEHITRNVRLYELQAEIKIGGRNVNNLRYANDTTIMAENKEKLKSLDEDEEESERTGLKLNIKKTKIMASSPITSGQTEG